MKVTQRPDILVLRHIWFLSVLIKKILSTKCPINWCKSQRLKYPALCRSQKEVCVATQTSSYIKLEQPGLSEHRSELALMLFSYLPIQLFSCLLFSYLSIQLLSSYLAIQPYLKQPCWWSGLRTKIELSQVFSYLVSS